MQDSCGVLHSFGTHGGGLDSDAGGQALALSFTEAQSRLRLEA